MNQIELQKEVDQTCKMLIERKGYVCPIDVLLELNILSKKDYDLWRNGKLPFMEQACNTNLSKLNLISTTIRKFAFGHKLQKSWTAYQKFGKGPSVRLRFSKSCNQVIEEQYATHYLDKQRLLDIKASKESG